MIAILSIKTKYVEEILKGNKRYEFRKKRFKKNVEEVLVYATKPIGKIVCKFNVGEIIEDKPEVLWETVRRFSGLTEKEFFAYFQDSEKGVAIEIRDLEKFSRPVDPKIIYPNFIPPQSWIYVSSVEDLLNSYLGGENG